jgi:predicted nucleic acid-binding protein
MPPMSGKIFLDTNILVYLYSVDEPEKKNTSLSLIELNNPVISTQVLSELANTLSRKFALPYDVVAQAVAEVRDACIVDPVMPDTIAQALALAQKYKYSYYDSLILAAALSAGCETLATEDMQSGQLIEGVLTIRNPFVKQ